MAVKPKKESIAAILNVRLSGCKSRVKHGELIASASEAPHLYIIKTNKSIAAIYPITFSFST
jgi:hypothetical protein